MLIPSVKKLATITDKPKELRALLEITKQSGLDALLDTERFSATRRWINSCYHMPSFHEIKIAMADELIGTYGVEYIRKGHNAKSPAIEYCNAGDTYTPTLLFVRGSYRVGDWGSIVERGNYD